MNINTSKSYVSFTIKKFLFLTVKGTFPEVKGNVELNEADLSSSKIDLAIPVAGLDTGNKKRNEHLQQDDFFKAEQHPEITFKSNDIRKQDGLLIATGTLNVAGTSSSIAIPFSLDGKRATGSFSLSRLDYKVGKVPTLVAAENVNVTFDCTVD